MKILDRYIFLQFIRTFLFASTAFVALFVLITLLENLHDFIDKGVPPLGIAKYYLLSIPETLLLTAPVSALLSSILVAGRLALNSELPAIRSAGVSMRQLLYPFLLGGMLISGLNLANAFWISPAAKSINSTFDREVLQKSDKHGTTIQNNLHILEPGNSVVSIRQLDPSFASGTGVSLEHFEGSGLSSRIDAASMTYDRKSGKWIFYEVTERNFSNGSEHYATAPSKRVDLVLSLKSLSEMNLRPDEMDIVRHYRYLAEKKDAGFAGLAHSSVKFQGKIAGPFASLIIILIGVPLSAKKKRGGLAAEIGISLFAGFLFLGLQKTIATIGYNGQISPILAAWLPNIIFLAVGYAIYRNAPD